MDDKELRRLIEADRSTDLQLLLNAKNEAKRRLMDEPSAANLSAFEKASAMLEKASAGDEQGRLFKNRAEALRHLQAKGYKVKKSKFYKDVKSGLCHINPDGQISEGALSRYIQHPGAGLIQSDAVEDMDADLKEMLRKKEQLAVRNLELKNRKEVFAYEKETGQYVRRDDVDLELVSRAVALRSFMRHRFTTNATEDSTRDPGALLRHLQADFDEGLTAFANVKNFHVIIVDDRPATQPQGEENGHAGEV